MSYAFWLVDVKDACGYAIFGNDSGLLYQAHPSRDPVLVPLRTQ